MSKAPPTLSMLQGQLVFLEGRLMAYGLDYAFGDEFGLPNFAFEPRDGALMQIVSSVSVGHEPLFMAARYRRVGDEWRKV